MVWMTALCAAALLVPATSAVCDGDVEIRLSSESCTCEWNWSPTTDAYTDCDVEDGEASSSADTSSGDVGPGLRCETDSTPLGEKWIDHLCTSDTFKLSVSIARRNPSLVLQFSFTTEVQQCKLYVLDLSCLECIDDDEQVRVRSDQDANVNSQRNSRSTAVSSTTQSTTISNRSSINIKAALSEDVLQTEAAAKREADITITVRLAKGKVEFVNVRGPNYVIAICETNKPTTEPPNNTTTASTTGRRSTSTSPTTTTTSHSSAPSSAPSETSDTQPSPTPDITASSHASPTSEPAAPSSASPNGPLTAESPSALGGAAQSDEVAVIVGCVVAVLVGAGIAVLAVVLIRRRRPSRSPTCAGDKPSEGGVETRACRNPAYDLGAEDDGGISENRVQLVLNATHAAASCVLGGSDPATAARTPSQPSADEYSVIRDTAEDEESSRAVPPPPPVVTPLYCLAEVPHARLATPSNNPADSPYEFNDGPGGAGVPGRAADSARTCPYTKLDFGPQEQGRASSGGGVDDDARYTALGPAGTLARPALARGACHHPEEEQQDLTPSSQTPRQGDGGVYYDLEPDPGGLYHVLEEDPTSSQAPQASGGGGGVYHVLEEVATSSQAPRPSGEVGGLYHVLEEEAPTMEAQDGATGVYHVLEENPTTQTPQRAMEPEDGATGVYHVLEAEAPTVEPQDGARGVYHVLEAARAGGDPHSPVDDGSAADYNSLHFDGKGSGQERGQQDSGQVYSHLNEGDGGTYNQVRRGKRVEVIDGDYSHIQ